MMAKALKIYWVVLSQLLLGVSSIAIAGPLERYDADAGIFVTCAIDEVGEHCWGYPTAVPNLDNPVQIRTASQNVSCAIDDFGVHCWGEDPQLTTVPQLQNPYAVDAHDRVACALDATGLVCWGPAAAELGPPPILSNPRTIGLPYAGPPFACALDDSGVKCWGDNSAGQLNVPPLVDPENLSVGNAFVCVIDGANVVCWGYNGEGQINVPPLSNPTDIATGIFFACAVDDTGVVCWGAENVPVCYSANCGPGFDYGYRNPPVMDQPFMVAAGYTHVCGFDAAGAKCWGRNLRGEADDQLLLFDLTPDPEIDADGDGVPDNVDNCPDVANSDQINTDGDDPPIGDACDPDDDNDNVLDDADNCSLIVNPGQEDFDDDGAGDLCDTDDDNDGAQDNTDACLYTPAGAVVNAQGCAIADLCPCIHSDGSDKWKNHGKYVSCVAHAATDFRDAGLINDDEHGYVVSEAGESACGHKD